MRHLRFAAAVALLASRGALAAPPMEAVTGAPAAAAAPEPAPPAPARPPDVALRFAWPRSHEARVVYRSVVARTGEPDRVFTARYVERATSAGDEHRIANVGARWEGAIPYPAGEVRAVQRASEAVVQRVGPDGAFLGLENGDALRPALQRIYADAGLEEEEAERAIARVEEAMAEEARTVWNLAVGFWIGAELDFGAPRTREADAPTWLLPALPVRSRVRLEARRRVPCTASERRARCVELTLRSEPDAGALPALGRAIAQRLQAGRDAPLGALSEVGLSTDLTLVTEPGTLLPYRVVWRRAVRAAVEGEDGPVELEDVERNEWSWNYLWKKRSSPN